MNVGVFTYDFFPVIGGQGRHVYEFYKQNEIYNKINLFVFSPGKNNLRNHKTIIENLSHSQFASFLLSIKLNQAIDSYVDKYKLDIVHVHSGPGGLFFVKRIKVPVIFTCHHTYWQQIHYLPAQKWKHFLFFLERMGYANAEKIICVSNSTKEVLSASYRIDQARLVVIPNGIPHERMDHPNTKSEGKQEILYVGRIDKRKGVDFLIEAFEILALKYPKARLHIVGDGKDRVKLQEYCERKKIKVVFHGYLPDHQINLLANDSAVQIIPSIFEGFGIVVLEAMARGLPVIATNVDGIKDIIQDGTNGLLVNYGDKQALSERIYDLLSHDKLSKYLVENASNCLKGYDPKDIYMDTVDVYEGLLAK